MISADALPPSLADLSLLRDIAADGAQLCHAVRATHPNLRS